jgi:hypothetical protein
MRIPPKAFLVEEAGEEESDHRYGQGDTVRRVQRRQDQAGAKSIQNRR